MTSDKQSKVTELNKLYDLLWQSSSQLDRALVKSKIRMVAAELDRMETRDSLISLPNRS